MIKQLKNYFYERFTDSTISPPNFLPMIVTTRDKATQLMEGKLEMPPFPLDQIHLKSTGN